MVLGNCKNAKSFRFYTKSEETARIGEMRGKTARKHRWLCQTLCEASSPRGSIAVKEIALQKKVNFNQPLLTLIGACTRINVMRLLVNDASTYWVVVNIVEFYFKEVF